MKLQDKIVEFSADIPALWRLQCQNLYNSKNLAALAVRECVQNSLDSIREAIKAGVIQRGQIDISWSEKDDSLTISDNGLGMDLEVLHHKFLTLGGTTKGGEDNTGGFGLAKSVILGCGSGFEIHTQDNYLTSGDIGVNPVHKVEFRQGTRITLYQPQTDMGQTVTGYGWELRGAVEDYILSSIMPKNVDIRIQGEDGEYKFIPTRKSRRLPAELGVSEAMIPRETKLEVNVFKTSGSVHYVYVRLRGLTQFKAYLSWNANCDVVVDFQTRLDPKSSEYPFSTNREGLKAGYQGIIEAIRDKVSQSPTSIAQDDRWKETLYDNVTTNEVAARSLINTIMSKQVVSAVKGTMEVMKGMDTQGGYVPVSVLDYVNQTAQVIERAAEEHQVSNDVVVKAIQPKTLFELNNPLKYSWLVYEDTEWKGHRRLSQASIVSVVLVWESILRVMAGECSGFINQAFYPGVVFQESIMGLCVNKVIHGAGCESEERKYVMINPLEIPSGSSMKVALWLMGVASHELAHVVCGSYEAHGETHSYMRELFMNLNLDNVEKVKKIVESSKVMRIVRGGKENPYREMRLEELECVAMESGVNVEEMRVKYGNQKVYRMRLTMAVKKMRGE